MRKKTVSAFRNSDLFTDDGSIHSPVAVRTEVAPKIGIAKLILGGSVKKGLGFILHEAAVHARREL